MDDTPYVVFPHGMLDPYFNRAYPLKFLKKLPYWLLAERRLLADATASYLHPKRNSGWRLKAFGTAGKWPGGAVRNSGAESARGTNKARIFSSCFRNSKAGDFCSTSGRIHRKKGCDLLIEAFAKHAESDPDAAPGHCGPDKTGWSTKLQALALRLGLADRITWPGMLTGDAKWGAFYAAEAFILPSHQENFGIAVAESLACSLPVLISDQVNIFEEVEKDGAALVAPDTLAGTADLIGRWIALSPEQRSHMRMQRGDLLKPISTPNA